MERSLTLVLNGREDNKLYLPATKFLTLKTMEAKELDYYISKKFDSSSDVREEYSSQIETFLEENKSFIETVENNTGKKFRGSIVITELGQDLMLERKKVLYKKDIILFQEIIKNKKFILALNARDYINYNNALKNHQSYIRIFPEYFSRELHFRCTNDNQFKRILGQWTNTIKASSCYYDIIRRVLKEYESRCVELKLDSLDVIYTKYKDAKKQQETTKQQNIKQTKSLEKKEPPRYKNYSDEGEYQGELNSSGQDTIENSEPELPTIGKQKTKTKVYPGQYSWFDSETE